MAKHRNYQRPPLPFIGSKLRWWRELQVLAMQMPQGACVFDAFGGSFSAARVIKDTRPDLTVITNDFCHAYRKRLNAAPQTACILKQLQAIAPKRSYAVGMCPTKYPRASLYATKRAMNGQRDLWSSMTK